MSERFLTEAASSPTMSRCGPTSMEFQLNEAESKRGLIITLNQKIFSEYILAARTVQRQPSDIFTCRCEGNLQDYQALL